MNKIYKTKYNAALGAWVAVPEIAKGRGKTSVGQNRVKDSIILSDWGIRQKPLVVALSTIFALLGVNQTAFAATLESDPAQGKFISISKVAADGKTKDADVENTIDNDPLKGGGIAIGVGAIVNKDSGTAIGSYATTVGTGAIAIGSDYNGKKATKAGRDTTAIGWNIDAAGSYQGLTLGSLTKLRGKNNIVLGSGEQKKVANIFGNDNTVIGSGNQVNTSATVKDLCKGDDCKVSGADKNIILGSQNTLKSGVATNLVLGSNNTIEDNINSSYVLGSNVTVNASNSVYIGDASTAELNNVAYTAGELGQTSQVIAGKTYNFAGKGKTGGGVITVGGLDTTTNTVTGRIIQNVAPGKISDTSTDAINGSQLYSVVDMLNTDFIQKRDTPVVYTDDQGQQVVKGADGKWYHPGDIDKATGNGPVGTDVADNTVQVRVKNADGSATTAMPIRNVGTALTGDVSDTNPAGNTFATNLRGLSGNDLNVAATAGDLQNLANTPLFFSADTGDTELLAKKPGETLSIESGKFNFQKVAGTPALANYAAGNPNAFSGDNLAVVKKDGKLLIGLKEQPEFRKLTVTDGTDTTTIDPNQISTKKVTGLDDLTNSSLGSDAANKNYVDNSLSQSAWIIKGKSALASGATDSKVNPDDIVDFINGTGTTASVETSDDKTFQVKYDVNTTTLATDANGSVTAADTGNSFATGNSVANAINTALTNSAISYQGDNSAVTVKPQNKTVKILGGASAADLVDDNIGTVGAADGSITVKLSKKLKDLESISTETLNAATSITTPKVTGLDTPTDNSDATNKAYVDKVKNNTLKLTGDSGSETGTQQLDKSGGLSFAITGDTDNITTKASGDGVALSLNKATAVTDGDKRVVTSDAVYDAIDTANTANSTKLANSGWTIQKAGANITGVAESKVNPDDTVNFNHGTGTTVEVASTDGKAFTVSYSVNTTDLSTDNDGSVTAAKTGNSFATGDSVANAINNAVSKNKTRYFSVRDSNDTWTKAENTDYNKSNKGAYGVDSLAAGVGAEAEAKDSMAIGHDANATGVNSIAMGRKAQATGLNSIAMGNTAIAESERSVAIGLNSKAKLSSITIGAYSETTGSGGIAIGSGFADETGKPPTGNHATIAAQNAIALGYYTRANTGSTIFGSQYQDTGTAKNNVVLGKGIATLTKTTAGDFKELSGSDNVVVGNFNTISGSNTVVLGSNITADVDNAAYIGDASVASTGATDITAGNTAYATETVQNLKLDFAGNKAANIVTFGDTGSERRLQNVAAGKISEKSTDAINGSQLYALAKAADDTFAKKSAITTLENKKLTFVGDKGNVERKLGETLNIKGGATGGLSKNNIGVVGDSATDTLQIQLAEQLTDLDSAQFGTNTGDSFKIDKDGIRFLDNGAPNTNAPSLTKGGLNNGGNVIKGVESAIPTPAPGKNFADTLKGINDTDTLGSAVNVGDLKNAVDGAITNVTGTINNKTFGLKAGDGQSVTQTLDGKIDIIGDGSVKTVVDNGQLKVKLANTITVGDATASNPVNIDGDQGEITGLTNTTWDPNTVVKDRAATEGQLADVAATAGTAAKGWNLAASANAGGEVVNNVATDQVKPTETVTFDAGKNIAITHNDNEISIATKDEVEFTKVTADDGKGNSAVLTPAGTNVKDSAGNESTYGAAGNTVKDTAGNQAVYNADGVTITPAGGGSPVSLTSNGLDNGGNKLSNVAAGTAPTDAVNVSQLSGVTSGLGSQINNVSNHVQRVDQHVQQVDQQVQQVDQHVSNINVSLGGAGYVGPNGSLTEQGLKAIKTYNVKGNHTYQNKSVIEAIKNINEQGIKFFHTNDGQQIAEDGLAPEDSSAAGKYSTAIGYQASVGKDGENSLAIGKSSRVNGKNSIAIGTGHVVNGNNSGAFGDPIVINGNSSYAVGNDNVIHADNTFVVGNNVTVGKEHKGAVVLGDASTIESAHQGALSLDGHAVAGKRGAGTRVVSVGSRGNERQIQNVAPGVVSPNSTDAINGSQLYTVANEVDQRASAGIASAMASSGLPQAYLPGKSMVGAAASHYRGESAIAIGISTISDNGKWILKGAANANSDDFGVSVGVGYQW